MSDLAECLFGNTIMLKCWYNGRTGRALAQEAIDQSKGKRIPFVSTPAAYRDFLKIQEESDSPINGDHVPGIRSDPDLGSRCRSLQSSLGLSIWATSAGTRSLQFYNARRPSSRCPLLPPSYRSRQVSLS
ncbi:hypothetical protein PR003_g7909 [Phytophthora rubi]|uniref:Uncharacterized protein n=1 Tax=Phytophthora rubi TaxID=129364 RepID=A0A6A3P646_9STRA|nr:hypothetical protein PR001_g3334 [Phytophthora rubi]KAE9345518.1 hypothetical protein PR003_g7909 [Phytophthora rubi]